MKQFEAPSFGFMGYSYNPLHYNHNIYRNYEGAAPLEFALEKVIRDLYEEE